MAGGGDNTTIQSQTIPAEFRDIIFGRADGKKRIQPKFGGVDNRTTGELLPTGPALSLAEYVEAGGGTGDAGLTDVLTREYNRQNEGR